MFLEDKFWIVKENTWAHKQLFFLYYIYTFIIAFLFKLTFALCSRLFQTWQKTRELIADIIHHRLLRFCQIHYNTTNPLFTTITVSIIRITLSTGKNPTVCDIVIKKSVKKLFSRVDRLPYAGVVKPWYPLRSISVRIGWTLIIQSINNCVSVSLWFTSLSSTAATSSSTFYSSGRLLLTLYMYQ